MLTACIGSHNSNQINPKQFKNNNLLKFIQLPVIQPEGLYVLDYETRSYLYGK